MSIDAATTRLSDDGQIELPTWLRHARQWSAGTRFSVQETKDGILLKPLDPTPSPLSIEEVAGCLKPRVPHVSLDDMDEAIRQEAIKRHAGGRY